MPGRTFCVCLLLFLSHAFAQPPVKRAVELPPTTHQYKVERVAEGVYAAIRTEKPNLMVMCNSTFIINKEDVVVVDTGLTPSYAAELIAEIRKLTSKPVSYVINTHWHDDHILGNAKFRDAYPNVRFIAHQELREYLPTTGLENRKKMFAGAPPVIQQLREAISSGKTLRGDELSDEMRESYATSVSMAERYMEEVPNTAVVEPTETFRDRLVLKRGGRSIELRHLGRSHTGGDIIVYLPHEKIAVTGDLVIAPVPLIGSDQSYVGDWSGSLKQLIALNAQTMIPGHGPIMHDMAYVQLLQKLMSSIDQQTRAAVQRGETLEQARKSVDLSELRKSFSGGDPVREFLFDAYVSGPGVAAAYREAKSQ